MNDFRVYYSAAAELLQGHDIYGKAYGLGSGYYKYSPFVAIVFVPFALLPFWLAKTFLFFFSSAATVFLFTKLKKILTGDFEITNKRTVQIILFIALATILAHLVREFHLGNVNMILLFLLFSAMLFIETNELIAGVLIGFCLLVKPHFIILLPLLIIRKKSKTVLLLLATIALGLFIPALFIGWQRNIFFLKEWLQAMKEHSAVLENATQTVAFIIQNNFFSDQSTRVYFKIEIAVVTIFSLVALIFMIRHFMSEKRNKSLQMNHFQQEYILLLAMVPSLTITDTEHFLFSLPMITFLLAKAFTQMKRKVAYVAALTLSLIFYGANWHDLLGDKLSDWLFNNGLLGVSNVMMIILFVTVFMREPPSPNAEIISEKRKTPDF